MRVQETTEAFDALETALQNARNGLLFLAADRQHTASQAATGVDASSRGDAKGGSATPHKGGSATPQKSPAAGTWAKGALLGLPGTDDAALVELLTSLVADRNHVVDSIMDLSSSVNQVRKECLFLLVSITSPDSNASACHW